MRRLALTAGSLALAAAITMSLLESTGDQARAQNGRLVQRKVIATDCSVLLIDKATLASDRPGIIGFLKSEEGDAVTANAPVAALKDEIARAALATAEEKASSNIQEDYAIQAHKVAVKEREIAEDANRRVPGAVPKLELDKLELAEERFRLAIEQAKVDGRINVLTAKEAQVQLDTYQILAPFKGVVSKVHKKPGEAVRQGDPILEIISTARMKVEGYISIPDWKTVKVGDPVTVTLNPTEFNLRPDDPVFSKKFTGTVRYIAPTIEPLLKRVLVRAEVKNPDGILLEGMNASMVISRAPQTARTSTSRGR